MRAVYCGHRNYESMLSLQERLFRSRIDSLVGRAGAPCPPDTLLAVEHTDPVYTIGRRDTSDGLGAVQLPLKVFRTRRGGGITWHGPGQLTLYPICNVREWWQSSTDGNKNRSPIRWYSDVLETAMCKTVEAFGVPSEVGCVGVWVPGAKEAPSRKIGSIGLQLSNWISMHGVGLNVSNDLKYFNQIVMCEMPTKQATNLHDEMAARGLVDRPAVKDVWPKLLENFVSSLSVGRLDIERIDAATWTDAELQEVVMSLQREGR